MRRRGRRALGPARVDPRRSSAFRARHLRPRTRRANRASHALVRALGRARSLCRLRRRADRASLRHLAAVRMVFALLIAAQDPAIASLRAEERSLLDQLDDALDQKRTLDCPPKDARRRAKQPSLPASPKPKLRSPRLTAAWPPSSTRRERSCVRCAKSRAAAFFARCLAPIRWPRRCAVLARWRAPGSRQDVRVISLHLSDARALAEKRDAFSHNLDYARDVATSNADTRRTASDNEAHIAELLQPRVREERSAHEHAYYENKELEMAQAPERPRRFRRFLLRVARPLAVAGESNGHGAVRRFSRTQSSARSCSVPACVCKQREQSPQSPRGE